MVRTRCLSFRPDSYREKRGIYYDANLSDFDYAGFGNSIPHFVVGDVEFTDDNRLNINKAKKFH